MHCNKNVRFIQPQKDRRFRLTDALKVRECHRLLQGWAAQQIRQLTLNSTNNCILGAMSTMFDGHTTVMNRIIRHSLPGALSSIVTYTAQD